MGKKLTQSQVSFVLASVKAEAESLLDEAKEYLRGELVPLLPTREEAIAELIKLAYDKPKTMARLVYDKEDPAFLEDIKRKRSDGYEQLEISMAQLRSLVDAEVVKIHGELLWDSFSENPLDMYLEDIRGLFHGDTEATEEVDI